MFTFQVVSCFIKRGRVVLVWCPLSSDSSPSDKVNCGKILGTETESRLVHSENGGEEGKFAVRGDQDGEGDRRETRASVRARGTASN